MKMIRALTRLSVGLVVAASWTCAAYAGDSAAPTKVVRIADLNLGSPQDVAELYRRINDAARSVCPDPDKESGIRQNQARYCLKLAVENAVHSVNSPALTAMYLHARRPAPLLALNAP